MQELEGGSGPYLCGDQYTLADVSMVGEYKLYGAMHICESFYSNHFQIYMWIVGETSIIKSQVPIFERMELACWWTDAVKRDFPLVLKYWNTIQQRLV